jgi:prephenate dehydrogenase
MGRLLARMFSKRNYRVIILGRNRRKLQKTAARIHVQTGDLPDLRNAKVVMVSVPIESTVDVCANALRHMTEDSLLIDISSVKMGVADRIKELVPARIEYLSIHPLFGPATKTTKGRNIVAVRAKPGPLSDRMISFLRDLKFNVGVMSAEEHDKTMAVFQVMHHYAFLVLGVELAKIIRRNPEVWNFLPRSLKKTIGQLYSMNKIIETVFAIQRHNPRGTAARRAFAASASKMVTVDDRAISEIKKAMIAIKAFRPQ